MRREWLRLQLRVELNPHIPGVIGQLDDLRQLAVGRHAGKPEGTGLGLPLTKRFVEMHGGTIQVKSCPNEGSTFSFTLAFSAKEEPKSSLADHEGITKGRDSNE